MLKTDPFFVAECENGRHGASCGMTCGRCKDDVPCNRSTGICENGCKPGWEGKYCTQKKPVGGYFEKKNKLNITACSIRYIKFDYEVAKG